VVAAQDGVVAVQDGVVAVQYGVLGVQNGGTFEEGISYVVWSMSGRQEREKIEEVRGIGRKGKKCQAALDKKRNQGSEKPFFDLVWAMRVPIPGEKVGQK
jgi:hypothetical protein